LRSFEFEVSSLGTNCPNPYFPFKKVPKIPYIGYVFALFGVVHLGHSVFEKDLEHFTTLLGGNFGVT